MTSEHAVHDAVYLEFRRIIEVEKQAAAAVTVLAMVNRAEALAAPEVKVVTDGKGSS